MSECKHVDCPYCHRTVVPDVVISPSGKFRTEFCTWCGRVISDLYIGDDYPVSY